MFGTLAERRARAVAADRRVRTVPTDPALRTLATPGVLRNVGVFGVCLAIGTYGLLTAWLVPLTLRVAYDPSIQYMLTSLAWFRGGAYVYIDHPGTPVEVLGTVLLLLSHPFVRHASELIDFHLAHPQYFLSVAQTLIVVASLLMCVMLARKAVAVTHWSLGLLAVAVSGLFFAVHPMAFGSLARWSHESFNFPAGTGLSLALLVHLRRPTRPGWRSVVAFGVGAGVLTSVQLYFAAWVVGMAVALTLANRLHGLGWRRAVRPGLALPGAALVGFGAATLPIHDRYGTFLTWVWQLSSHESIYGEGPQGFSTPGLIAANVVADFSQAPLLGIATCVIGIVVAWRLSVDARGARRDIALWSTGLGLVCQAVVLVVLAAKHPGVKYLLPLAATLPVLLAATLGRIPITRGSSALVAALSLLSVAALAVGWWSAVATHLALRDMLIRGDQATETVLERAAAERGTPRPALQTLWTYGTNSPCYALWFGDETTGEVFNPDIGRLCPHDLNLSVFSAQVIGGSVHTPLASWHAWDVAIVPEDIVGMWPGTVPPTAGVPSTIPSLGYGNLVFFINPDSASATP